MAGPIIEALRRMRANRMERRGFGDGMGLGFRSGMRGGLIRDMLTLRPPVTQPEALNAVSEYRPMAAGATTATGPMFASIGTGSGRQDRRGYTVARPVARTMNPDPDGPDTEYKRDYDGDGRPDPVQGGTEDLPAPPTVTAGTQPTAQLDAAVELDRRLATIQDRLLDPRLSKEQKDALLMQSTLLNQRLKYAREDRQQAQEREDGTIGAKVRQLEPLLEQAKQTGNWMQYAGAAGTMFTNTDDKGNPLPGQDHLAIGRAHAVSHIHDQVRGMLEKYPEGLATVPEQEYIAVMRGLEFAHSMSEEDRKNPEAWRDRVHARLNDLFNRAGDDATDEYYRAVANMLLRRQLGQ